MQSPSMETCNSDMINMVTKMEELKIAMQQANDELETLNQQGISFTPTKSLENVESLENQIMQIQGEIKEITNQVNQTQKDKAVATEENENLKKDKNQLTMDIEEAQKKANHLAERRTVKLALVSAENELKSLKQKSMDEEQQKLQEIAKINIDNKKEITELEKKNESVVRHFAAAKVANPTSKSIQAQVVQNSNPTPKPVPTPVVKNSIPTPKPTQTPAIKKSGLTQGASSQAAKTYSRFQKPRRQLVTPPPKNDGPKMSVRRKRFSSSSDDEELFK